MTVQSRFSQDPNIAKAGRDGAEALLKAGQWADARAAYEALLPIDASPEALQGLGEALWWLGDMPASNRHYRRAYAAYLRQGRPLEAARVALALTVTYKTCLGNDPVANGWLARAERALGDNDAPWLLGNIWLMRAYLQHDYDLQGAVELTRQALELSRSIGDRDMELCALGDLGVGLVMSGQAAQGLALIDEAMAGLSGGEYNRRETVVYVSCVMLHACEAASDWERATKWRPVADDLVDSFGCPYLFTECRYIHAAMLVATGRWDEAAMEIQAGLRLTTDTYPTLHAANIGLLAGIRMRQGRLDEAEALLGEVEGQPMATTAVAELHMVKGRYAVARALLQRCLRYLDNASFPAVRVQEILIEAHLCLGDQEAARASLAMMAANPASNSSNEARARCEMSAGRIALFANDPDEATARFETAAAAFLKLDMPFEAALARLSTAQAQRDCSPELAVAEAQAALNAFEKLGAGHYAGVSSALLRSLGVAARPGPRGAGLLSQREREVLDLIREGLSNPEIAGRLYISRKTAAHHVSSILEKLGLRNRAEAAGYAARISSREGIS